MVRCFIGYLLPEDKKEYIEEIKEEIKNLPMKCKFVERENLHISFSFLGEVEEKEIEKVAKELESICKKFLSFDVAIERIKLIPNEKYIRVLALDITPDPKLEKIIKEIKERIGGDVKPPHLTLCRVKSIEDKTYLKQEIKNMKIKKIFLKIDKIQLIKSKLDRNGPKYSVIFESTLPNN